jgi:peroxiredoxin
MRRLNSAFVAALCASVSICLTSCGQTTETAGTARAEAATAAETGQEKNPEDVLRRMVDFLVEKPALACNIVTTIDIESKGVKNHMETKMALRMERPNRLSLVVAQGVMGITLVSDGKQLIQYMPALKRYSIQEAPADFAGLSEKGVALGIPVVGGTATMIPTDADEFFEEITSGVTKSEYLGTEKIGDAECDHLRFIREDLSWDIWIETGEKPLVRKILPDLSKQFAQMEGTKISFVVEFSDWDIAPKFTDTDFAFTPPADAEKVESLFEGLGRGEEPLHALLGEPAVPFETVDLEGQPIDLKQHIGKEMILLDFWATWCGPCVRAMPDVDAVAKKYADRGLVFYAVNVGEEPQAVKEFLKANELEVPVAMDPDGAISESYQVQGIPQTVLIGKDGRVQVVHVGFSSELGKTLEQNFEDLLAGKDLASEALNEADEKSKEKDATEAGEEPQDSAESEASEE